MDNRTLHALIRQSFKHARPYPYTGVSWKDLQRYSYYQEENLELTKEDIGLMFLVSGIKNKQARILPVLAAVRKKKDKSRVLRKAYYKTTLMSGTIQAYLYFTFLKAGRAVGKKTRKFQNLR